jgi:hypothetical protein
MAAAFPSPAFSLPSAQSLLPKPFPFFDGFLFSGELTEAVFATDLHNQDALNCPLVPQPADIPHREQIRAKR